jgi:predicted aminopeptidase
MAAKFTWKSGPKTLGCAWHMRGIYSSSGDSLVVDVFIMRRLARRRPVAVTIGRYRNYKPIKKQEWQLTDPTNNAGTASEVARYLESVGASKDLAQQLGGDVEQFLASKSETLQRVLESISKSAE